MIHFKYHAPGSSPATLVSLGKKPDAPVVIQLFQYDETTIFEGCFDTFEELMSRYDPSKVNWINIDGLTDSGLLRKLADRFKIHPLALEDVLNTTQRPKVEQYEDQFFIVSEMIYKEDGAHSVAVEQLSLFLGEGYVITIQEESQHDVFTAVRNRLHSGRGKARAMKADYLAYALLDATVDQFFPVLEELGDSIEDLEDQLIDRPSRDTVRKLHGIKRLLLQLRRAAWPQREIFSTLIRDESTLIHDETKIYLRDCYDHTTQIIDIMESFRDLTAGLMDFYISSLGFKTNEIMRVLTVISSIFIPLTFIAGIYGMNFDTKSRFNMPELEWPFGYLYCLALMATVAGGMVLFFKRKKWL